MCSGSADDGGSRFCENPFKKTSPGSKGTDEMCVDCELSWTAEAVLLCDLPWPHTKWRFDKLLLELRIHCPHKRIITMLCECANYSPFMLVMGISILFVSEDCDIIPSQHSESFFTRKTSASVYLTFSSELSPIYSSY